MNTFLALLLFTASAFAHQTSQAFLAIKQTKTHLEGRWDIALKDLQFVVGLDADENGEITWGEVRAAFDRIDSEAIKSLHIADEIITPYDHRIEEHLGSAYLVLLWKSKLPRPTRPIQIDYRFLFDADPTHRALLNYERDSKTYAAALTDVSQSFEITETSNSNPGFFVEGVWHIWTGFDHILFLLALLLPTVISGGRLGGLLRDVAKIVTAFTLAHSITLSLAACGVILLPAKIVEPIIGFSVLLAAINNLVPMWREKGWLVAFGFGLIHGFGFADALRKLSLPASSLANCLLLFNCGVEVGQLAIVSVFVPLAFVMRDTQFYRGVVVRVGSAAISIVAAIWVMERLL